MQRVVVRKGNWHKICAKLTMRITGPMKSIPDRSRPGLTTQYNRSAQKPCFCMTPNGGGSCHIYGDKHSGCRGGRAFLFNYVGQKSCTCCGHKSKTVPTWIKCFSIGAVFMGKYKLDCCPFLPAVLLQNKGQSECGGKAFNHHSFPHLLESCSRWHSSGVQNHFLFSLRDRTKTNHSRMNYK